MRHPTTRLSLILISILWTAGMAQDKLNETTQKPEATANDEAPIEVFEPREYADADGQVLRYRLLKPKNYDSSRKYPLVIFLHGAGERGDDNAAQLVHGMADFCKAERRKKYPCYVLAPQCPKGQKWADVDWSAESIEFPEKISNSLALTLAVVDSMLNHAPIDRDRIYITGLSMGGYGTWDAIARRPHFFAAAMPICGGGAPKTVERFKHVPIACFHGSADRSVPVEQSRAMIKALKAAGGQPKYTEYEGVGHNSWTQTYANEATFEWLFDQRRPPDNEKTTK